jgi:hypothetical protein
MDTEKLTHTFEAGGFCKAFGKTIKVFERGRWKTVARVESKGRFLPGYDEANAEFLASAVDIAAERDKLKKQNTELLDTMKALFKNCAMINNKWGEGSNQKESDVAIKAGKALILEATGETL